MRRILIPLVFAALLTVAAVIPRRPMRRARRRNSTGRLRVRLGTCKTGIESNEQGPSSDGRPLSCPALERLDQPPKA